MFKLTCYLFALYALLALVVEKAYADTPANCIIKNTMFNMVKPI